MSNVLTQIGLYRPWQRHRVTVCLPHLETPAILELVIQMWKHQDEMPFILVIDTGSRTSAVHELLDRLAADTAMEIARLAIETDVEHPCDRVAIAMDYAFARCPTEFLLASHTDLFPRHRGLIRKLLNLCCAESPVVGWEMSPRGPGPQGEVSGSLSDGIPGHACTMFHMPTMDRIGAGWSIRRAHHAFGLSRSYQDIAGWPDTEVCLGKILDAHAVRPLFLGRETNHETQETDDWVHARSSTVVLAQEGRLLDRQSAAIDGARDLLSEWKGEERDDKSRPHSSVNASGNGTMLSGWPMCHSLREIGGVQARAVCLHPRVHAEGQIVNREICVICGYRTQAPPETFRALPALVRRFWRPETVAVVIPCHNYGRFLGEALESVLSQTRSADEIIVVDDASDDDTPRVAAEYRGRNVRYLRVDYRHSQRARQAGLSATHADVLCFLDADDRLDARYLEEGLACFDDYRVGIVYSDVSYFGHEVGRSHYPAKFDRGRLARRNFLHSGSLVLREALQLSQVSERETDDRFVLQDWLLWRRIADQGWQARKQSSLYGYRKHPASMTAGWQVREIGHPTYFESAGLAVETVTLFIPLAGRAHLWPEMSRYLDRQAWPHDRVRLILFDTSHHEDFSRLIRDWIRDCDYRDVRHIREVVGESGIADLPREDVAKSVTRAMARIYNRLAREASTDYVWILEDDVFPPDDACERLLRGFDQETASVSGAYRSRSAKAWVVWNSDQRMILERGDTLQTVGGNGFGCVVLRGDVLRNSVFTASIDSPAYDNAFYLRLPQTELKAKVDWSVICDHRIARQEEVPS